MYYSILKYVSVYFSIEYKLKKHIRKQKRLNSTSIDDFPGLSGMDHFQKTKDRFLL